MGDAWSRGWRRPSKAARTPAEGFRRATTSRARLPDRFREVGTLSAAADLCGISREARYKWKRCHPLLLGRRVPATGLVHHSDRGCQYAAEAYQRVLRDHGIVCSMSRTGDCWDNAVTESFFATLKTELIHRQRGQRGGRPRTPWLITSKGIVKLADRAPI